MTREEYERIHCKYNPRIEQLATDCEAAAKASQDAWESGDEKAAHASDWIYCKSVELLHAYILQKSIDLGSITGRPEDERLLTLIKADT